VTILFMLLKTYATVTVLSICHRFDN